MFGKERYGDYNELLNKAFAKNKDEAWGKLLQKKIDIIQTDWPIQLGKYLGR